MHIFGHSAQSCVSNAYALCDSFSWQSTYKMKRCFVTVSLSDHLPSRRTSLPKVMCTRPFPLRPSLAYLNSSLPPPPFCQVGECSKEDGLVAPAAWQQSTDDDDDGLFEKDVGWKRRLGTSTSTTKTPTSMKATATGTGSIMMMYMHWLYNEVTLLRFEDAFPKCQGLGSYSLDITLS